jgi:flagellar hook-associated protein 3 FlgL
MRVATSSAFDRSIAAIGDTQAKMVKLQNQLGTGQRLDALADDPAAAAEAERLRGQQARLDNEKRMTGFARMMLNQAEGALGSSVELMQTARELLLQASNGTLSVNDRALIGEQLQGIHDELLSIANRRDGAGGFIFAGAGSSTAPFVAGISVTYTAQTGQQGLATDPSFSITQDGAATFMRLNVNGTNTSVFQVLTDAITAFRATGANNNTSLAAANTSLQGVDQALEVFALRRTDVGEQLRAIDSRERLIENGEINSLSRLSELTDLDYAKAISDMNTLQTSQQAAMRTYSQVARLSLFDYL